MKQAFTRHRIRFGEEGMVDLWRTLTAIQRRRCEGRTDALWKTKMKVASEA
jgi:hypothetical protein